MKCTCTCNSTETGWPFRVVGAYFHCVALLLVLLFVALQGCTVGPKYVKPSVPTTPAYKEEAPASYQGSEQWKVANPGDQASRGNWWEIFGDPELNKLEEQVATSNQGVRSAVPRGSRDDSFQSRFAISNHLDFAERKLCEEFRFFAELSDQGPRGPNRLLRAAL